MLTSLFAACWLIGFSLSAIAPTPVLWEDLADLDIFRVDDTFYYSASNMHYSPGAPILSSKDLINWEFIGHSVPVQDFGSNYYLQDGASAYVKGIYASSLRQRPSDGQWFWVGCIEYSRSYIYTAPDATGPWTVLAEFSDTCFYDCGLLFDDDMTPYIASQSTTITISQLSDDLTSLVSQQQVYDYQHNCEGSRFYKINGTYYILNDDPGSSIEYVIKSDNVGGTAHQGGIVDDGSNNWYYMAFCDAYPEGRSPVIAPVEFTSDGFPKLSAEGTAWPTNVDIPLTEAATANLAYKDEFHGSNLGAQWEWNHNPDTNAYSVNNGLTLNTATVTDDFYLAKNTLTHRVLGPASRATIELDYSRMEAGDRAGLAILRDQSGWIGILKDNGGTSVGVWSQLNLTSSSDGWTTADKGSLEISTSISSTGTIFLRASGQFSSNANHSVSFSYSTDGNIFNDFGSPFIMDTSWQFYLGYRFAIFNYATDVLGGSVQVKSFNLEYA